MSFPRSFRAQTWFLKLPDGQIEVATASDLERSFRCGLIGPHTIVRAVASPVWSTLADVAELDRSTSLAPVALATYEAERASLPPVEEGARWRAGRFNDDRPHRAPTLAPFVLAFIAAAAVLFGASSKLQGAWPSAAATTMTAWAAAHAPSPKRKTGAAEPTALAETPPRTKGPSREVLWRLHERDVLRRMYEIDRRRKVRARREERLRPIEPLVQHGAPGDPLDAAL